MPFLMDVKASNTPMQMNTGSIICSENCNSIENRPSSSFDSNFSSDIKVMNPVQELNEYSSIQVECMSVDSNDSYTTAPTYFDSKICDSVSSTLPKQSESLSDGESKRVPWIMKKFYDLLDGPSYDMSFHKDKLNLPPEAANDIEIGKYLKRKKGCDSVSPDIKASRLKFDCELSPEEKRYCSGRNLSTDVLSSPRMLDDIRVKKDSLKMLHESRKYENPFISIEALESNPSQCQFGSEKFDLFNEPNLYEIQDESKSVDNPETSQEFSEYNVDFQFGSNFPSNSITKPINTPKTRYRGDYPVCNFKGINTETSILSRECSVPVTSILYHGKSARERNIGFNRVINSNAPNNLLCQQIPERGREIDKSFLSQSSYSNDKNNAEAYFKDDDGFCSLYKDFPSIGNLSIEETLNDADSFNERTPTALQMTQDLQGTDLSEHKLGKYEGKQQIKETDQDANIFKYNITNSTTASPQCGLQKDNTGQNATHGVGRITKTYSVENSEKRKVSSSSIYTKMEDAWNIEKVTENPKAQVSAALVLQRPRRSIQNKEIFETGNILKSSGQSGLNDVGEDFNFQTNLSEKIQSHQTLDHEYSGRISTTEKRSFNKDEVKLNRSKTTPPIKDNVRRVFTVISPLGRTAYATPTNHRLSPKKVSEEADISKAGSKYRPFLPESSFSRPRLSSDGNMKSGSSRLGDRKSFLGSNDLDCEDNRNQALYEFANDNSVKVSTTAKGSCIKEGVKLKTTPPTKDKVRKVFEVGSPIGINDSSTSHRLSPINISDESKISKAGSKNRPSVSKSSSSRSTLSSDGNRKRRCPGLDNRKSFLGSNDLSCEDERNPAVTEISNTGSKPRFSEIEVTNRSEEVEGIKESKAVKVSKIRINPKRKSKDAALAFMKRM